MDSIHATNGRLEFGAQLQWRPNATEHIKLDACAAHWQCSAMSLEVAVRRGSALAFDTIGVPIESGDIADCTHDGVYVPGDLLNVLYARVS